MVAENRDKKTPDEYILYDNGGNGNALDIFKQRSWCKVLGDGNNIGLNAALNQCAKEANGEYFYLPHTDMALDHLYYEPLLQHSKNLPPTSFLFCSRSIEPNPGHTPFHLIENHGQEIEDWNDWRNIVSLMKSFDRYRKDKSIVTAYRMPFFMHRDL